MMDAARIARLFAALSNPHRVAIFERLRAAVACCGPDEAGEMCVCDIGDGMGLSPSTVSHHLKELKNAGLVRCEKRGQWVYCTVNPEAVAEIGRFLGPNRGRAVGEEAAE